MTEAEADALKMLPKLTEAAEAPMLTDMREGALKKIEVLIKTAKKAHKRLEILLEELQLMDFEGGAVNRIILGVMDMVVEMTDEELRNMPASEADAFKMLSTMVEAAEEPMEMKTRERESAQDVVRNA